MSKPTIFRSKGLWIASAIFIMTVFQSCSSLSSFTGLSFSPSSIMNKDTIEGVSNTVAKFAKAAEEISPEQEYFIGRSVAALVINKYPLYQNTKATNYLNLLGQSLAAYSSRPDLFKGYRFAILNTKEINAFATPGGHILISRGMLALADNEEELGAILAHEIGHIAMQHGLKAIQTSRWTDAGLSAVQTAASTASNGVGADPELLKTFNSSMADLSDTLIVKGYSRDQEIEADKIAVEILKNAGFNPTALIRVLEKLEINTTAGGAGFGTTHPNPAKRIASIQNLTGPKTDLVLNDARIARYKVIQSL